LLWEQLTGREHLLFYGRLKNLKGAELVQAVDESLRSVNLFNVGNKKAGQYSGGMKRRLSVAISLIGNPQVHSTIPYSYRKNTACLFSLVFMNSWNLTLQQVVYMDEPSTGLDPASRMNLWNVIKKAKKDRAIILTSM
jgi:ABC-type multidrug transport system ATPase subunit